MKKFPALFLSIGILITSISGCGFDEPELAPDESVEAIYNLFVTGDDSGTIKLGISKEEITESLKNYDESVKNTLRENFVLDGLTVDDTVIDQIYEARQNALKKMSADFKIVTEDDSNAEVLVSTTYFNETFLYESAIGHTLEKVENNDLSEELEYSTAFGDYYSELLIEAYNSVTPSDDKKEITVFCTKQNGIWFPSDMSEFGDALGRIVSGAE